MLLIKMRVNVGKTGLVGLWIDFDAKSVRKMRSFFTSVGIRLRSSERTASLAASLRLLRQWRGIVDHDGAVGSPGGEAVAVVAERYAVGAKAIASEGEEFLTGLAIPNLNRRVGRRGGQALAVRSEGDASYCPAVSLQRQKFVARLGIPQLCHCGVVRSGGNALAIRAECDTTSCAFERRD